MQARETIIKLESLLDLSARLTSAESRDFIINAALLTLMGKLRITRACALEKNGDNFTVINKKGNIKIEKIPYFTIQDSISSHENVDANLLLDEGLLILLPMNLQTNEIIFNLHLIHNPAWASRLPVARQTEHGPFKAVPHCWMLICPEGSTCREVTYITRTFSHGQFYFTFTGSYL